eukprot:TRINITY_DN13953_c0_g1_i2.p1 TRINITY_DN13953_c0_g1~~TRINITY_DN13953_c0_g1_i2.p1  ORF type:complete len:392 (+),score=82.18 TRINITY_DN13953_c0_g1_i2:215-1390(+)
MMGSAQSASGPPHARASAPSADPATRHPANGHTAEFTAPLSHLRKHIASDLPKREFLHLELSSQQASQDCQVSEAQKAFNRDKNRYTNILPCDTTRVKLSTVEGVEGSDYINANYIDGEVDGRHHAYIATQGPLTHTKRDFWRMIWEHGCTVIVFLGKDKEGERIKVDRYWPERGEPPLSLRGGSGAEADLMVEFQDDMVLPEGLITRFMRIHHRPSGKTRDITQFHYEAWPDHGVPKSTRPIRHLVEMVDQKIDITAEGDARPPMVVHCSAGVGRTGAFVTIHLTLERLRHMIEDGKDPSVDFSLFRTVQKLRAQRPGMVQQQEQYLFCYEAVAAEAESMGLDLSLSRSSSSSSTPPSSTLPPSPALSSMPSVTPASLGSNPPTDSRGAN